MNVRKSRVTTAPSRRQFLKLMGGSAAALSFASLGGHVRADAQARASRFIVFYFPDGVPGASSSGDGSLWHAWSDSGNIVLPEALAPLEAHKSGCLFFRGLSMGGTDAGSHPGGAKKLLTGVDGGGGESIDRYLARTVGASAPVSHVYLGAMANANNASGDKFISYIGPGLTAPPEDNPAAAFQRLFGSAQPSSGTGGAPPVVDDTDASILDAMIADLDELRARLGTVDKTKLDLHMDSLREIEKRVKGIGAQMNMTASCTQPSAPAIAGGANLYDPALFPQILRAQIDLMVQAMACGVTKVGVIQCSSHTSELIMSRFPGTPMYDAGFDMRSHQASHYGASHDYQKREFRDFVAQRKWFVSQFAYLIDQLKARPDGAGTMFDASALLLGTEVCDGNTHSHDDMPFVIAGGGGGALAQGRVIDNGYQRHSNLLVAIARAMGDGVQQFGQDSVGPLSGVLA